MKGDLSKFETKVKKIIKDTYKTYESDVVQAIGYKPKNRMSVKTNVKDNNIQDNIER